MDISGGPWKGVGKCQSKQVWAEIKGSFLTVNAREGEMEDQGSDHGDLKQKYQSAYYFPVRACVFFVVLPAWTYGSAIFTNEFLQAPIHG
eukprot:CAMPEP_0197441836 /NCGR_PEP_ID=MMETSP1175-20131217/7992_1 /TAXON_ID=1003142 /ORGANISM="Triceratium dubium, Strain CCMP147" /LENGTH=89 /DNA_ID=CAMNT_0042972175 /DNA_START=179 /DNA_END=448 /DNA_ORIENTATION=+